MVILIKDIRPYATPEVILECVLQDAGHQTRDCLEHEDEDDEDSVLRGER